MTMNVGERWVDIEEDAKHFGAINYSVYRRVEEKAFPAHRVGRLLPFDLSEVDAGVAKGGGEVDVDRPQKVRRPRANRNGTDR
jgi:predicted DNA-binding transcriptional regulator AlpA